METRWFRSSLILALGMLCALPAMAQAPPGIESQPTRVNTLGYGSVERLLGKDVMDHEGARLAHVGGLLFTGDRIAFLIVYVPESGGTWRHVPVPASMAELSPLSQAVILELDRRALLEAPAYAGNVMPDYSDPDWGQRIHSYYGDRSPHPMESYIIISR
jgi:hypothetical protein